MHRFAALYRALDASTSNLAKQAALQAYLRAAPPEDAAWAVYFLAGGKPRQLVPTRLLRETAREAAGLSMRTRDHPCPASARAVPGVRAGRDGCSPYPWERQNRVRKLLLTVVPMTQRHALATTPSLARVG